MNSPGLMHGDAHFDNILTDGHRLYFADLGLATSERFALTPDELSYLHHNASLDHAYVLAKCLRLYQSCSALSRGHVDAIIRPVM